MVRIVKKERRIILDDLLPWIRREQKVQWFILCFIVALLGVGIWFLAKPSPKQTEAVAISSAPSAVNTPAPTPAPTPVPVQPEITVAQAEVKPSVPPVPQAAPSVQVLPEPERQIIRTQPPPTSAHGNFPPDRVMMRHMIIVPDSIWDRDKRYFYDRRTREYFITPPNVYLFDNSVMLWTSPFNGFAERYREQGRIFRSQAVNEPPIYVNWRYVVDKYGERGRPPMGR